MERGGYLKTREPGASLWLYATAGDTLSLFRQSFLPAGNIEIYVNGQRHNIAEGRYTWPLSGDEEFLVSGLGGMMEEKYWIQIRNPMWLTISLRQVKVHPLSAIDCGAGLEAEEADELAPGWWLRQPYYLNPIYSNGYILQTMNQYSRFYIPVENAFYATVTRPLSPCQDESSNSLVKVGIYLNAGSSFSMLLSSSTQ